MAATAQSTLVIKTDGVQQSYADIGKLIGPLQTTNSIILQLNETMAKNVKAQSGVSKDIKRLADATEGLGGLQLQLQERIADTADAAVEAAEKQVKAGRESVSLLKSINFKQDLKAGVDTGKLFAKVLKESVKIAQELYKTSLDCLKAYQEQNPELETSYGYVLQLQQGMQGVKAWVGQIIDQNLAGYFAQAGEPADALFNVTKTVAHTTITIVTAVRQAANAVSVVGDVILSAIYAPMMAINKAIQDGITVLKALPFISEEAKVQLEDVAEVIDAFTNMHIDGLKQDVADFKTIAAEADAAHKSVESMSDSLKSSIAKALADKPAAGKDKKQCLVSTDIDPVKKYYDQIAQLDADWLTKKWLLEQENTAAAQALLLEGEQQYQADRTNIQLATARATGDQLFIVQTELQARQKLLDDQAAQAELDRAKAIAEAKLAEEQRLTAEKLRLEQEYQQQVEAFNKQLQQNISGGLTDAFTGMFETAIEGSGDFRQVMYDSFKSMAKNIFTTSISNLINTLVTYAAKAGESQAAIPVIGPILAAAASGAVLATMGIWKAKTKKAQVSYEHGGYISQGLVRGGVAGRDSVSAMLQPGERVLSKSEAKDYDENKTGRSVVQNITINVNGNFNTPAQITQMVRQTLIPELNKARQAGYVVGA